MFKLLLLLFLIAFGQPVEGQGSSRSTDEIMDSMRKKDRPLEELKKDLQELEEAREDAAQQEEKAQSLAEQTFFLIRQENFGEAQETLKEWEATLPTDPRLPRCRLLLEQIRLESKPEKKSRLQMEFFSVLIGRETSLLQQTQDVHRDH